MSIKEYKYDDVLESKETYVAHGVNCMGTMGAGVARAIAEKWPQAESHYKRLIEDNIGKKKLGTIQFVPVEMKKDNTGYSKGVINMFIQEKVGSFNRAVNYGAIAQCFSELNLQLSQIYNFEMTQHLQKHPEFPSPPEQPVVAIPRIGAGLGGGNWDVIEEIINQLTPDIDIVVYMGKINEYKDNRSLCEQYRP